MKNYVRIYLEKFGYGTSDFIPCEVCSKKAVDIHHIEARGMGGSKDKDTIENIMALCRSCHIKYGDKKDFKDYLKDIHMKKLIRLLSVILFIASCSYRVTFGEISFLGFTIKEVSIVPKSIVKNPLVVGVGKTKKDAAIDAHNKLKAYNIITDTLYVYNTYVEDRLFTKTYTLVAYGINK